MIKYLRDIGYNYKKDYNDLINKEFTLTSVQYQANSDTSTLQGITLDRQENYSLFLKDFDALSFLNVITRVINNANIDGVNVSLGSDIEAINVENGFNISMSFIIQG